MKRLDWEAANRRERDRAQAPVSRPTRNERRALALIEFAWKHKLSCFACGTQDGPWAKSGTSKRGPWIICLGCVTSGKQSKPVGPIAEA